MGYVSQGFRGSPADAPGTASQPQVKPYGGLSRIYDYEYSRYTADIDFYLERLSLHRVRGRLLDLGAGTGRVTLALAKAGYEAAGLDNSASMIRRARRRRAALGPEIQDRVRFSQQDMTAYRLPGVFAAAFICFSTLALLPSAEARQACLERTARHLAPGGLLYIDLFAPDTNPSGGPAGERRSCHEFIVPPRGDRVVKEVVERPSEDGRMLDVTYRYLMLDYFGNRLPGELTVGFGLARLGRAETEAALDRCGFDVEEIFGDYRGRAYEAGESPRMIFEARRREDTVQ